MPRWLMPCLAVLALAACGGPEHIAEFWRPISAPNIRMPLEQAQKKLNYDLSQCNCGIYPDNVAQPDIAAFEPGKQRMAETGVNTTTPIGDECIQRPSLVVSECMRARGWEVTNCSGRMPVPGGGSLCTAYAY